MPVLTETCIGEDICDTESEIEEIAESSIRFSDLG